jgi:tetratricopeptide (TPR) repeat protein
MTKGNSIPLSGSMIRKNIFFQAGGFFEKNASIGGLDDYDLWLKTSLITDKFKFINRTLGLYRIHAANMTENSFTQINKINIVYEKYLPQLNAVHYKQAEIIKDYYTAIVYERMKNYKEALQLYKKSLEADTEKQKIKSILRIILTKLKASLAAAILL